MNYNKLLIVVLLNGMINSSLPTIIVESHKGSTEHSSTQYSFVKNYIEDVITKKDDHESPLSIEKEKLIRTWIESTAIYTMNN